MKDTIDTTTCETEFGFLREPFSHLITYFSIGIDSIITKKTREEKFCFKSDMEIHLCHFCFNLPARTVAGKTEPVILI